jgi:hypothetical protein
VRIVLRDTPRQKFHDQCVLTEISRVLFTVGLDAEEGEEDETRPKTQGGARGSAGTGRARTV